MGVPVKIALNGMNNRAAEHALPADKARLAVNCIFDDSGNVIFPNPGAVSVYEGDCHSLWQGAGMTLFVEDGSLKKLNDDYTATVLRSGLGSHQAFYALVGSTVYWASHLLSGKIINGVNYEWGTPRPPRQPDCTAVSYGGMFAGEYRVAITWLGSQGEEGGTGASTRVTVAEGGGIVVNNFPTPPSYVTGVLIYVSSVNGKQMWQYGEYAPGIDNITLTKRIGVIPLSTQFAFTPRPKQTILAHYGRIYYTYNNKLYFTELQRYGLQKAGNFWRFDSDVKTVVSCPGVLYIGTLNKLYSIRNIDGENAPVLDELQNCASVTGSECYDPNGVAAYFMSHRGWIEATPAGLRELSFDQVAIPFFGTGTMSVSEIDGLRYLTFIGQDAAANPLTNADHQASEIARGAL